jgi:hypothetical protein
VVSGHYDHVMFLTSERRGALHRVPGGRWVRVRERSREVVGVVFIPWFSIRGQINFEVSIRGKWFPPPRGVTC